VASRFNTARKIGIAVTFAISAYAISTASYAYTAEEQRLCMSDAFKFCSSEIPNGDKVTACLQKNQAQLSPGCKSVRK
jgi:hypothetical protein